jgi:GNAT superfamily N-acetyltransferase
MYSFIFLKMKIHFQIMVAHAMHYEFAHFICDEMASSAKARGTGIARRTPEYIRQKMMEGKAVIAFDDQGHWAGFCYIESWSHGQYVANSGLIVAPQFRKHGLAKLIKQKVFALSRTLYPDAKIFGLTTGLAVMKINSDLGYKPVTYSELTQDEAFWAGCKSCINYEILQLKDRRYCLCTAMLFDPAEQLMPKNYEATDLQKQHVPVIHKTILRKSLQRLFRRKQVTINEQVSINFSKAD